MQFYADVMSLHFPVPLQGLGMRPRGKAFIIFNFPREAFQSARAIRQIQSIPPKGRPRTAGPIRRGAGMQQVSISGEPRPVFVISKVLDSVDFAGLGEARRFETSWLADKSTNAGESN
jgi:hypothetical protein